MLAVDALDEGRPPMAGVVPRPAALHLDHVGAEIGEQLAAPGTREDSGEFEDADAGERLQG